MEKVAVIGAGIMGHGIAQVAAQGRKTVVLVDVSAEMLDRARKKIEANVQLLADNQLLISSVQAVIDKISYTTNMAQAVKGAGIVIEAVPERIPLKENLYKQLDELCDEDTIFASNTSGIPINTLAAMTNRPEKFIGTHFYMPAHLIPLVEIIQGNKTTEEVIAKVINFIGTLGKKTVHVRQDIPGFIGNRLQHALAREAMSLVQKGIASSDDVDTVVKNSLALRLVFTGPLEQRDLNGLDTHLSITEYLYADLENATTTLPILAEKVAAGHLGLKTGKGFYDWVGTSPLEISQNKNCQLINLLRFLNQS